MSWVSEFCKHNDDSKRQRVATILDKLITLTIEEVEMYPSIQAKIWGNIGQVSDLLDTVLDSFIKRSVTGGLGSAQSEIMADTAVALASSNVQLVALKVISRLCRRVNHEFIKLSGAIYDFKITKEMRTAATSARAKYMQYLESERSKEKTETKSFRGGNRFFKTKENVPPNGHAPNK
ncbi:Neurofibromin [Araneus ventricosus]|uniref:Neurofibromin n=1 Tax=Araneus ventricosus TaxID=182803 RepID=A0A4Y2K804_ARAVE|nr:Neurofibromin [Araneus ventricosus]